MFSKSLVLRVAMLKPLASAMAAICASSGEIGWPWRTLAVRADRNRLARGRLGAPFLGMATVSYPHGFFIGLCKN
jgi:hypothetical protein